MPELKHLSFGQTPWDNLDRDALLREVQRMYATIESSYSILNQMRAVDLDSSYWGKDGVGGRAWEMSRQVIKGTREQFVEEDIYHAFFRYAPDLLFDQSTGYRLGFGWAVCNTCGGMVAHTDGTSAVSQSCKDAPCQGTYRALDWNDLRTPVKEGGNV